MIVLKVSEARADLSLTSADNPRTPQLAERLSAVIYKRHRVYRKLLAGAPLDVPVPPAAPAAHPGPLASGRAGDEAV